MPTSPLQIDIPGHGETTGVAYGPARADGGCVILAHGAGAGQEHPFITATARTLETRGLRVVTFDFLYMHRHRSAPDKPAVLEATWRAVMTQVVSAGLGAPGRLILAGKSMGGRIASMVLASDDHAIAGDAAGLVLLGYPLHPPGQPAKLRIAHLPSLRTPTLVVQGSRDEFGTADEVRDAFAVVPPPVDWHIVDGGDHSFKMKGRGASAQHAAALEQIYDRVAAWCEALVAGAQGPGST